MSSPLKKKKKDQFSFVQSRYRKQEAKEDAAIMKMNNHIQYMVYLALYEVLGFKVQRLKTYYAGMQGLKVSWAEGEAPTDGMLKYCDQKNIPVYKWMKSIPQKKKFELAGQKPDPQMLRFIEASMLIHVAMGCIILKENWKISNEKLGGVLNRLTYYIECYTTLQPVSKKPYLSDASIELLFHEELNLDLETGKKWSEINGNK